jgi:GDPmannose 4,6-dehydratase
LDWRAHTVLSHSLHRPTDISEGKGNAEKAERVLGWKAEARMRQLVAMMVRAELKHMATAAPRPPS